MTSDAHGTHATNAHFLWGKCMGLFGLKLLKGFCIISGEPECEPWDTMRGFHLKLRHPFRLVMAIAIVVGIGVIVAQQLGDSSANRSSYLAVWAAHTVDDPASADAGSVDLLGATDFRFTITDGGWAGANRLKVNGDGTCEYLSYDWAAATNSKSAFGEYLQNRRADFSVDKATVAELRRMLVQADFFRLKKEYHGSLPSDDGEELAVVRASGKQKSVFCDNVFPPQFESIRRFVNVHIIGTHTAEISAAKTIQFSPNEIDQ